MCHIVCFWSVADDGAGWMLWQYDFGVCVANICSLKWNVNEETAELKHMEAKQNVS